MPVSPTPVSGPPSNDDAIFIVMLLSLPGVGRRTAIAVVEHFPTEEDLRAAEEGDIAAAVGQRASAVLVDALRSTWNTSRSQATALVGMHTDAGLTVMAYGSRWYPPLLASSPDPPAVLYVKGEPAALSLAPSVAVVGTRRATKRGLEIARRLGHRLAEAGALVVSGLAAGIDTAGHEGALEAGRTVAVMGTPIDKVYPAANRALAGRIASSGALVSEYPIGSEARPNAFVDRDRIQAWLSDAVVPVQTGLSGGTQHTIRFALDGRRRLLCPRLPEADRAVTQNAGIFALLDNGQAEAFDGEDLATVLDELVSQRTARTEPERDWANGAARPSTRQPRKTGASARGVVPPAQAALGLDDNAGQPAEPASHENRAVTVDDIVAELEALLDRLGPHIDEVGFDQLISAWRARRHPGRL